MKITNQQVIDLKAAIEKIPALSKAPKAVFALARNLARLNRIDADIQSSRRTIFASIFGDGVEQVESGNPKITEFNKQWAVIAATESDFTIHTFDLDDLNVEVNPLSPKQIADLALLFDEATQRNGCDVRPPNANRGTKASVLLS